mgnify:CR=1 FL=1
MEDKSANKTCNCDERSMEFRECETVQLNSFFNVEEVMDFITTNRHNTRYSNEKLGKYKKVLNRNKCYPNVGTKKQFSVIMKDLYKNGLFKYFSRLIKIIQSTLRRKGAKDLLDYFTNVDINETDDVHYSYLAKYIKNNDFYLFKRETSQPVFIHNMIKTVMKKHKTRIKKFMDIGCGNGWKTEKIGSFFNLDSKNIVCADIEKWFSYNNNKRSNKKVTQFAIPEKGRIEYPEKSVSLVTIIHVIHHWCYDTTDEYIERMKSIYDMLEDNGMVVIVEHDIFTVEDACLVDIEHALYEVIKDDGKKFYKEYQSRFLNFIELEIIMKKAGFKTVMFEYYTGTIDDISVPDKSYVVIYKKI